jgi:uncharacterized protein (DUF1330 family)
MPAYLIAFVDIHDRARFAKEYVPPSPRRWSLLGDTSSRSRNEARTLEGAVPPGRTVIIEFPDLDRAQNWYTSDAYAPLLALRKTLATTSLVVVPGGFTSRD